MSKQQVKQAKFCFKNLVKKLCDFFALYAATYAWHAHVKNMAHGHPYSIPRYRYFSCNAASAVCSFFLFFFWEYVRDVNGRITSYQLHSSITSCVEKSANLFSPILFNFELHLLQLQNIFVQRAASYHLYSPITSHGGEKGRNVQIIQNIGNTRKNTRGLKTPGERNLLKYLINLKVKRI